VDADQLLFAYGILRGADLQREIFGRTLEGDVDTLPGFTIDYVETTDRRVSDISVPDVLPLVRPTHNPLDKVIGQALRVTDAEVDACDDFEVALYRRIAVTLASGRSAWVYVAD